MSKQAEINLITTHSGGKPLKPRKTLKQPLSRVGRGIDSRHSEHLTSKRGTSFIFRRRGAKVEGAETAPGGAV